MALCTLDQVKARLGMTTSGDDALLGQLITEISARLAREAQRLASDAACLELTSLTEVFSIYHGRQESLYLAAWPVSAITSVKEGYWGKFDDSTALVEGEGYTAELARGVLWRCGYWSPGRRAIQIIYTGGYVPAGDTPAEGQTALPDELVSAAITQVAHLFQRRKDIGSSGQSVQGGSVSWSGEYKLLAEVAAVCHGFRRMTV